VTAETDEQTDIFWSWFPLGGAGLRTICFSFSIICIFILQVATITVGKATPKTPFLRLQQILFSTRTFKIVLGYLLSACWFGQVYIWLCSNGLTWVTRGDRTSPDRLDERPIWFLAFFIVLGFVHAVKHVFFAQSTLHLPISDVLQPQTKDQRTRTVPDTWSYIQSHSYGMAIRSAAATIVATVLSPFVYTMVLRQPLWKAHLALAKLMFNLSRSDNRATGIPPVFGTLPTILYVGFWLGLAWEFAALSLLSYFKKPPVKNGLPWTSTGKDPNGSLLNGLKSRRELAKTFAFWELAIIAESQPDRRKAIFADIERKPGPIWSQMLAEALKILKELDNRIQPPVPPDPSTLQPPATLPKILGDPRQVAGVDEQRSLLAPPSKRDVRARQKLLEIADDKIKQLGSHPETVQLPGIPDTTSVVGQAKGYFGWFLWPTNASKINATVLGEPSSNAALIVDAIEAVTKMLTASLQEDAFGKAMDGVPDAVKQFTKTIDLIEGLLQQYPTSSGIAEVKIILNRLRSGLSELLTAFQMFLGNTGLGIADLNAARKASGQLDAQRAEKKRAEKTLLQGPERQMLEDERVEEDQPVESWREWNKPKTTTKLFAEYSSRPTSRRQVSSGRGSSGRANGTARPREMEQVR
jgi:nucleoporin NDC1